MKHPFTHFLPLFSVSSNKIKVVSVLAMIAIACVVPALAEDVSTDDESEMAEIVVTATRYGKDVKEIPANVTVITEKDIKNSTAQNVADLLRDQVGIKVNDVTGNRRSYTVDIRGFGETAPLNTLVLVDGRRVNEADLSGTDWSQIPIDRVERIEIIRGGRGSVLYGDNASGGVVNIITKKGRKLNYGIGVSAGSYSTYKGSAYISGEGGPFSFAVTGSRLDSDGYRDNSDTEAKDVGLDLGFMLSDKVKLDLNAGYHEDDTGLPGAIKESDFNSGVSRTDSINPYDFSEVYDSYIKLGTEIYFFDNSFLKITFSGRNRDSSSFASFVGGSFDADAEIDTISVSPQVVLMADFTGMDNKLTAGFDYQDVEEDITNDLSYPPFFSSLGKFDLERTSYGYYVYDDLAVRPDLSLSAGYRYSKADFDFDPFVTPTPFGGPPVSDSTSEDENSYTAGVNYVFQDKSYAYASYARSFRFPVLDEYFDYTSNTVNSDLKAQTSDHYEIGARYYFNDESYAHVNVFRIDTDDEVYLNPTPFGFGIVGNDNLDGETRRDGMEISFFAKPLEWFSLKGSYTYTEAEVRDGQFENNDIPDVPNHKGTLGVTVHPVKGLTFALNSIYVGERPFVSDWTDTFGDQDKYVVTNVKLQYRWRMLSAFLDINNIANEQYSEYGVISIFSTPREEAFYPSPERNFRFGVSVDL